MQNLHLQPIQIPSPASRAKRTIYIGHPVNSVFELEVGAEIQITHSSESVTNTFVLETSKKGLCLVKANSGAHNLPKNR